MRERRVVVIAAIAMGVAVALAVAGLPLYVFPSYSAVARADLVYVIGPPTPARMADAQKLLDEGVASHLLVSVGGSMPASTVPECTRPDVTCATPEPFTTKGEVALLQAYARDHAAQSVVVLTFTPHVARTRYIFGRCYAGDVTVVPVEERLDFGQWVYQYLYQSTAFVKAWLLPCAEPMSAVPTPVATAG
ncbi:YdcF family protein [uncultured Microbacterium sp.]|uniref:YdcF family protein n=1 Tax=uncultured Microbacterium sp. TaxID=191216 RepID=UPI00258B3D43|nr:YdcF family protein [uncultured Microbacterium sp.]